MHRISRRVRNKYMKVLVSVSRENPSKYLPLSHHDIAALMETEDFDSVMLALEGLGLLSTVRSASGKILAMMLTHAGNCYFENRSDEIRRFVMNSVIIPILVAIITAFITVYILPSLGTRAQLWLSGTPQSQSQSLQDLPPTCVPSGNPVLHTEYPE